MAKFKFYTFALIALLIGVAVFFSINGNADNENMQFKKVSTHSIERVSNMKIFFGHQSVGGNILDGIKSLDKDGKISIISTREAAQITNPAIYHAHIGQNGSPQKKIDDFSALINSGIGDKIDLAIMKFCYIDFNKNTDTQSVFESYSNTISQLQIKYPNVKFVHTTVPLISNNMTAKDWIKKALGRSQKNDSDNIARNKYNKLVRSIYGGKEPILDLAEMESTYPDGKKRLFTAGNEQYEAMVPEYTDDGGHLNAIGKKHISAEFFNEIFKL